MSPQGSVSVTIAQFYEVIEYFLRPENATIWSEVQTLAQKGDHNALHAYVLEAQRLSTSQRNVRVAVHPAELEGKSIQPGNAVVMLLVGTILTI